MSDDGRKVETRPVRRDVDPKESFVDGIVRCWCSTCQRNADVRQKDMTCLGCNRSVRGFERRPELDGKDKP